MSIFILTALFLANAPMAEAVTLNGIDIQKESSTGVNVNTGGSTTNINTTTGTGGVNLQTNFNDGSSVNINGSPTSGLNLNATNSNGTSGTVNIQAIPGTSIQLQAGSDSLTVFQNSLSVSDKSIVLNLQNGSDVLIKTDGDLQAYNKIVIEQRPSIVSVSSEDLALTVSYRQPARFLAIFRTDLDGTIVVNGNGVVEVKLPWYSFLYRKNSGTVKQQVTVDVQSANSSGQLKVSAVSSNTNDSVTVQNKAKVVNVVTSSIDATVSGSKPTNSQALATPAASRAPAASPNAACNAPSEFPFAKYPTLTQPLPNSQNNIVIAGGIDAKDNSRTSVAVARVLDLKNATVTTAYVFDAFDTNTAASFGTVYLETNAKLELEVSAGSVIRVGKADLVRKAMVAAGLLGSECNY